MTQPDNPAAELPQPIVRVLSDSPEFVDVAFDECQKLAESHYENFSVVTRLVRKELRKHYYSVYAFSRGVDDLGDEFPGNRLAMLDLWEEQLNLCYDGEPSHIYFSALQATIREFDIPKGPFVNLIEANRKDQEAQSYENIDGVFDYCVYSANPVGRILLYLSGYREPSVQELSDKTCTALQLANFWQDVSRDYVIGRVYVPQDELNQFGVAEAQLASPVASESFR
ncbi:MAG: squalene/phytoene synthase family protein, partial [Dehalococcoidia bacterium]